QGPAGPPGPMGIQGPQGPAGSASHAAAIYRVDSGSCKEPNSLTLSETCSFDLASCITGSDVATACGSGCTFVQSTTSQVCTHQVEQCDLFGCRLVCDQFETTYCGSCSCTNTRVGFLVQ